MLTEKDIRVYDNNQQYMGEEAKNIKCSGKKNEIFHKILFLKKNNHTDIHLLYTNKQALCIRFVDYNPKRKDQCLFDMVEEIERIH